MEIRAARRSERDEVLDLLELWYGDREFFARYNHNDPGFRDELCLVARAGGRLVSTVQIFGRRVNLAGAAVPIGGIGSVFTREDSRHSGAASALMRLAVETMTNAGFELSLLFAERLTFYHQFGWREVERKFSMIAGPDKLAAPVEFTIDAFDPARDLAAVAAIHRAYSGRIDLTAIRDEAAWRGSLTFAGNQPMHPGEGSEEYFIVCRGADDRIAAYARAMRLYEIPGVMEFGYSPGQTGAMLALFKYLGEAAAAKPASSKLRGDHRRAGLLRSESPPPPGIVATHTAHDPELEKALAAAGCPVSYYLDNNYMWRVLAPEKLARRLGTAPEAATARAFDIFADPGSLYWTSDRF
ncbi:MAG: GNAT family N-acetyltransferase [Candidatus Binataceae bacterium]